MGESRDSAPAPAASVQPGVALSPIPGTTVARVPAGRLEPFLLRTAMFAGCDKEIIARAAPLFLPLEVPAGTTLVSAGEEVRGLGVVFSGEVVVQLGNGEVERLGVGEPFGDAALLTDGPSPLSVVAQERCRVLWVEREAALAVVRTTPAGEALLRRMAAQIYRLCAYEREVALTEVAPEATDVVRFVEVTDYDVHPSLVAMIPAVLVRQHRVLPLKLEGKTLTVGMVAPRNGAALAELHRVLQTLEIEVVAIGAEDFSRAVVRFRIDPAAAPKARPGAPSINPDSLTFEATGESDRDQNPARAVGDEVIRFVNKMIVAALDREASDIHIEPTAAAPRIRFRVNGMLQEWADPVPAAATIKAVGARIKVLAGLDITERRVPQDGRIAVNAGKRELDLRVSTLPANRGEKIALRLLEAAGSTRQLEQIFFDPATLQGARRAINRPYGGIIVAGPTGSGKTSTLYSILNERRVTRPDSNILTVEDPIEYRLNAVTQVQVNPQAGLTFASALRSLLRQDPDVIVVGETRDTETAVLALEAAITGHLLLTSLHANTAISVFHRLENLGCSRSSIAQGIAFVLVQRLVRKLCVACRRLEPAPRPIADALAARGVIDAGALGQPLPFAPGCEACGRTGQMGRLLVLEALAVNDEVREALSAGKTLQEVEQIAVGTNALVSFPMYAAALLRRQLIGPAEVLLALAD
jgi:type IV pilus assembly protein PilB